MYLVERRDRIPPAAVTPGVPLAFNQTEPLDLREYWRPIRDHLALIILLFVIVESLTLALLLSEPRIYTSTSTVLIEREAPQVLEAARPNEEALSGAETFYATQYEMLRSRSLAADVIRDLGLEDDPEFSDRRKKPSFITVTTAWTHELLSAVTAWMNSGPGVPQSSDSREILGVKPSTIDAYIASLDVHPVFGTRMVEISFGSPHPVLAAKIANAHVQEFIHQNYMRQEQTSEEAQHYLGVKLTELEARTERSEAALNSYRRQRGIVEFSLDDRDQMVSDQLADLNRRVMEAEAARIGLEADLQTVRSHDYDSLPAVVASGLIQNLKEQATRLEGEYANLSNQYTSDYPPVAQLHAQLEEVQAREKAEVKKVVESVEAQYTASVERENDLRREFDQEKSRAMALKDASLREAVLERDVETNRALYQSILERMKTLGVASESQMTNVTLIDPGEVPKSPSSPKIKLSLVLSGFLALLSGLGLAFILEAADRGLRNADDVQSYLQLPNLATVVQFARPDETDDGSTKLLPGRSDSNGAVVAGNDRISARALFGVEEAYRAIRTGILLSRSERPPRTILFSSAIPGEGKSWTARNSAIMFAQLRGRVLLIDADLRRPRCHEMLGCHVSPGLTELLTGSQKLDEAIQPTMLASLFFLSAGQTPPNPTELLDSQRMREILAVATSSYDHVLIDSPPILPVSDSVVLSTLVDGVVVVVSAKTTKTAVRDACERLIYVRSRMLGVVLTKVDPNRQREYLPYNSYKAAHT